MTILPTRDTFGTPIVNMLDVKSVLIYFHHATSIFLAFFRHGLEKMVTENFFLHDSSWTINVEVGIATKLIRDMTPPKKTTLRTLPYESKFEN